MAIWYKNEEPSGILWHEFDKAIIYFSCCKVFEESIPLKSQRQGLKLINHGRSREFNTSSNWNKKREAREIPDEEEQEEGQDEGGQQKGGEAKDCDLRLAYLDMLSGMGGFHEKYSFNPHSALIWGTKFEVTEVNDLEIPPCLFNFPSRGDQSFLIFCSLLSYPSPLYEMTEGSPN